MELVEEGGEPRAAEDLVRLHVTYAMTRDKRLRHELASAYAGLAGDLAAEAGGGEAAHRAARAALVRAIDRYVEARHGPFPEWAGGRIRNELRRARQAQPPGVPGPLLEHHAQVVRTLEDLTQEMGRSPTVPELAARSGLTEEQVVTAMDLLAHHED